MIIADVQYCDDGPLYTYSIDGDGGMLRLVVTSGSDSWTLVWMDSCRQARMARILVDDVPDDAVIWMHDDVRSALSW